MVPLLIESTASYAGKTMICLGLGLTFQKDGFAVSYFKPFGRSPVREGKITTDEDALLIRNVFHLEAPLELICPVVVTQDLIIDAYDGIVKNLDKKVLGKSCPRRFKDRIKEFRNLRDKIKECASLSPS